MNERVMQFRVGLVVLATVLIGAILVLSFMGSAPLLSRQVHHLYQVQRGAGRDPRHAGPQGGHPHRPGAKRPIRRQRRGSARHGRHRPRPPRLQRRGLPRSQLAVAGRHVAGVPARARHAARPHAAGGGRSYQGQNRTGHDRIDHRFAEAGGADVGHAGQGRPGPARRAEPHRPPRGGQRRQVHPLARRDRRDDEAAATDVERQQRHPGRSQAPRRDQADDPRNAGNPRTNKDHGAADERHLRLAGAEYARTSRG